MTTRGRIVLLFRLLMLGVVGGALTAFYLIRLPAPLPDSGPALVGSGTDRSAIEGPLVLEGPVHLDGPAGASLSSQTGATFDVSKGDLVLLGPAKLSGPSVSGGE